MRMWTEEVLPSFDTHLRKKWVHCLWRSGIPPTLRRQVWPLAIGNRLELAPSDFRETVSFVQSSAHPVKGVELIDCDLPRTRLMGVGSKNSLQLGMLLRAVSALRPQQGYVQGMSFLGALLLEVMPVEEAFVALGNLLGLRYFPDFLSMQVTCLSLSEVCACRACTPMFCKRDPRRLLRRWDQSPSLDARRSPEAKQPLGDGAR